MNETDHLVNQYYKSLDKQQFVEKDLDYSALEKYKPMLNTLSLLGNNGVVVFDLYRKENVFTRYNFTGLYGYDQGESEKASSDFFYSKMHPEDFLQLIRSATEFIEFLLPLSKEERSRYKLINDFRVADLEGQYVRLLEQYQVLEFDKHGNIWLGLGVLDVSPDQDSSYGLKSQLLDIRSGDFVSIPQTAASSKVTSLSEKIQKVNGQRKKIIEKLHAENATEVSKRILKYGLLQ